MKHEKYSIRNKRLTDEEFFRIRKEEVLPMWETGKEIEDLDECIEIAKELSVKTGRNYSMKAREAKEKGVRIMEPHFGRALTEYMIDGMNFVQDESPMEPFGMWTIFSDSYTRKCNFEMAQVGIERSRAEGTTMLNGWPIVNFGVKDARRIKQNVSCPMHLNSTDEDGRLASEIALAAGWSACNSRSLQEVLSHCKDITLEEEIRINQYETRLAAIYHERGVPQAPHIACNLTGYDSCGFKSFVMVSQSLMGGEQGLKHIELEFGLNMNLQQDTAMINVTKRLCEEYCRRFGYNDIYFTTKGMPFLGAWPARLEEANSMVAWNASIAIMAGCNTVLCKCQDEAFATPTKEGMAAAVRVARHLDRLIGDQRYPQCEGLLLEEQMLELEVRTMMERCLEIGDGDIARGLCIGVDLGWVSTMISPWRYNKGNVRLMRDSENAMRYFSCGDMPLPQEVKEYHLEKLKSREALEGRPLNFGMVVSDLQYASRLPKKRTEADRTSDDSYDLIKPDATRAKKEVNKSVVIGTIGQDAHMVGGWVLSEAYKEAGFKVAFLGAVVPQKEFIDAAVETGADAILVSSSYGMGLIDCEGMRDKCIEAGLEGIILYAGGTVAAPLELERNWPAIEERFRAMGFDRVFKNTCTAEQSVAILKADLGIG